MKIGYKSREVSTTEFLDQFDPPLVFHVKAVASNGWLELISQIDPEIVDVKLSLEILNGVCFSVSDGEERATVEEFYKSLKKSVPEMADTLLADLAYSLGANYIKEKRERLAELKKTPEVLNGTEAGRTPA